MLSATAALLRLEAWLETTRGPEGYGGPVVHWWGQCLRFTGAASDWRYEGLIQGYLWLWERTHADVWLERACRAASDVLAQALPSGGYRYSSFELNPAPYGTPHEAACDVALLRLALALRTAGVGDAFAARCAAAAAANLRGVYAATLWDEEAGGFRDVPYARGLVPNKQATVAEAWLALAEWERDSGDAERYALPALQVIVRAQRRHGPYAGAIDQIIHPAAGAWPGSGRYFPFYIARCLPALVAGASRFGEARFAEAACAGGEFLRSQIGAHGECPLIVYVNGVLRRQPDWIAGGGDILRGLAAAQRVGGPAPPTTLQTRILAGQDNSGGIATASGFAAAPPRSDAGWPDLRDVLHVVGWADKAFRYLTEVADPPAAPLSPWSGEWRCDCTFGGHLVKAVESPEELRLERMGRTVYRWQKGARWAWIGVPWLDVR